jgi:hypothetical protein
MKVYRKSGGVPPFILNFWTSINQLIDDRAGIRARLHIFEKEVPLALLWIESRNRPFHLLCSIPVMLTRPQIVWKHDIFYGFFISNSNNKSQNLILLLLDHYLSKFPSTKTAAFFMGLGKHFCSPCNALCHHITRAATSQSSINMWTRRFVFAL